MQLKSSLYHFCYEYQEETISLLYKYNYLNIVRDECKLFCAEFCDFIQCNSSDDEFDDGFFLECFRQMLKYAGRHGELPFLHNNDVGTLIKEYYLIYLGRCYTYINAHHFFDKEDIVQPQMDEVTLDYKGMIVKNYTFVDSIENKYVQISDVFVGILSKMFYFFDHTSLENILTINGEQYKP